MRIGIFGGDDGGGLDAMVAAARQAAADGFAAYWTPQIFGLDALTALAVVGREVPGIELGTSVVPTYPRHPMVLAQQALTTQAASGGRLVLGIGLSHQVVVEGMWGYSFDKPVRHLREYLSVLLPLVRGESVAFEGDTIKGVGAVAVPGATPFPVVIAALGPQLLALAGTVADGTITWCVGPATLAAHTVPAITVAAEAAGRPAPRVIAALPVCVTDDPAGARQRAAQVFAIYGQLPSYRAMLDREGAAGPADIAVVGGEGEVGERIAGLAEIGVTDFAAVEFGATGDERARTRAALRALL
ncbi:MAG: TIGR03564 family F420-dependent LLM class oxidoreductase [Acidimicrobiales bacterium]|nr:TIGR03564 family F420-dependent LLM class oxidoreductase [Acidimicrobiales bacterium]